MKRFYSIRLCGSLLGVLILASSLANAQARYKHIPRVKTDAQGKNMQPTIQEIPVHTSEATIASKNSFPEKENNVADQTALVSSTNEVAIHSEKITSVVKHPVTYKNKQADKELFTQKVKTESKLMEVKEVQKTALLRYLLWFIITLLLGIALFVLAFIFFYLLFYTLYYIFLVFGIVGLLIACVVLIFGLTGLI